jgi:hypothetical protein
MCTIIAKKFPNVGWVGVKNRDRPMATKTDLLRDQEDSVQRVTLMDEMTRWSEGMNSNGVSIISSSLSPATNGISKHPSRTGNLIRAALAEKTVEDAVRYLRDSDVSGCVMIFDKDRLFLIEGKTGKDRTQVVREITDDWVARTNHGIWIPSAGYQKNSSNLILRMRRVSSEARLKIANYILQTAEKPEDMMPLLAKKWIDNPQLNTIRTPIVDIDTRTTEQLMLDPNNLLMLVRNIDGILEFNQKDANPAGSKVLVGIAQS